MGDKTVDKTVDKKGDTMGDTITIKIKDAVRGHVAMRSLSDMKLKGTAAYLISKAGRQVTPVAEDYQKGVRGIMEDHGAIADAAGNLIWDTMHAKFSEGRKALKKYEEKHFDLEAVITVRPMKIGELLAGIPAIKDKEGQEIQEAGVIEPFILEGIGWMLVDD